MSPSSFSYIPLNFIHFLFSSIPPSPWGKWISIFTLFFLLIVFKVPWLALAAVDLKWFSLVSLLLSFWFSFISLASPRSYRNNILLKQNLIHWFAASYAYLHPPHLHLNHHHRLHWHLPSVLFLISLLVVFLCFDLLVAAAKRKGCSFVCLKK